MIGRTLFTLAPLCLSVVTCGCGGGGGGTGAPTRVQERAIATTRNSRAIFAIAGFGMAGVRGSGRSRVAPAPVFRMGRRAQVLAGILAHSRAAESGFDDELKLYYTVSTVADGSGRQDLFTDEAHTDKAGDFVWPAPTARNAYPVTFHESYHIGKGEFDGERGTLDVTFNDAAGNNGSLHLVNTNAMGEKVDTRLDLVNGVLTAQGQIETPSGDSWRETDVYNEGGQWVCRFEFADGSYGQTSGEDGGWGEISYYGPDGALAASGTYDDEGNATLKYEDGTQQTVDVDDWSDGSYDGSSYWDDPVWDDVFDDGSDRASRRHAPRPAIRPGPRRSAAR